MSLFLEPRNDPYPARLGQHSQGCEIERSAQRLPVMSCPVTFFNNLAAVCLSAPLYGVIVGVVAVVGLFKTVTLVLSYGSMLADLFVLAPKNLKKYGAKSGSSYALVTGCTAGIGEQFAHKLAKQGYNLALVSRTESKLVELKNTLEAKYNIKAEYLAIDIATDAPENYSKLSQFVAPLDVQVLINNVGQSHSMPVPFLETSDEEMRAIININNVATLKISQIVISRIEKTIGADKSKRGLVLTMGSFAGLTPTPLLATYSGSKAFLQSWNNAIARELEPKRIDCQLFISYLVTSNMSKIRKTSAMVPNPRQFVNSCFQSIGRRAGAQDRYASSTPYWSHALMHWWIDNAVGVWSKLVIGINYNFHVSIRKRALRKAEREAKQK